MSFKVIGIGEVLWDLLPGGKQIGGALANDTITPGRLAPMLYSTNRPANSESTR